MKPKVGLFVTCLVDLFRPNVGFAAVKLLEDAGFQVLRPWQIPGGSAPSGDGVLAENAES